MDQHPDIATAVTGSPEGGFIVDMHDGVFHEAHISHADDADAAAEEGQRRFASLHHRDRDGADDSSPHHHEITAMRQEITDLKGSVSRLEANVADLLKNREGVKTAEDQQSAQDIRDLQARVDKTNDTIEHARDDGQGDDVQRDAHGQDVRDPDRVETAATKPAAEPRRPAPSVDAS